MVFLNILLIIFGVVVPGMMLFSYVNNEPLRAPHKVMCYVFRFAAWITNTHAVMVMDYDSLVTYTLAKEKKGELVAALYPVTNIGQLILRPLGLVDANCSSSYCYAWRYLSPELRVAQELSLHGSAPSWDQWMAMNHTQKIYARDKQKSS